jgi:crotonobetainyl-CoA:carnitine CoA-transferase CaiB-like acyl-CoA transferase
VRLPLEGKRVLDLTVALAGPWCAHILGALGAEVIKLEPLTGDETRSQGPPFWGGESPLFLAANSNKRSVAVALGTSEGRDIALQLAATSDVFLQNLRSGAADRLGLGFEDVRAASPSIVYCNISAYGHTGPLAGRPAYDLLMQAEGGVMSTTGEPDGRPLRAGPPVADLSTGMWAAIGVLGALLSDTEEARLVDTSLYESVINLQPIQFAQYAASGEVAQRLGAAGNILVPFETLPTEDGHVVIAVGNDRLFARFADAIGLPGLATDPRFADNAGRVRNRSDLVAVLAGRFAEKPTAEWVELLAAAGIPVGTVKDVRDIADDPQFEALGLLARVPHDRIEDLRLLAPPVTYDGARLPLRSGAPALGADTREVLAGLGLSPDAIEALRRRDVIQTAD